jgi:hypothetical protein
MSNTFNHDQEAAARVRKAQAQTDTPQADVPAAQVPPVVALQAMVGNRAMRRMVVQPKMTVTAANDAYESEADSVADKVVQNIQTQRVQRADEDEMMAKRDVVQRADEDEMMAKRDVVQRADEDEMMAKRDVVQRADEDEMMAKRDVVQRADEDEMMAKRDVVQRADEDEMMAKRDVVQRADEDEMMAKRDVVQRAGDMSGSFEVGNEVEQGIANARGGGQALPESVRGSMEGAFGADFSNVRVHTDAQSDTLNRSVGAKAFTQGSDIFFKSGAFQPESSDGQHLLAHELTHTIQQGAVQQKREE